MPPDRLVDVSPVILNWGQGESACAVVEHHLDPLAMVTFYSFTARILAGSMEFPLLGNYQARRNQWLG